MSRYLITHSLLSSWLYAMQENPFEDLSTERNAAEEFMQVLKREPTPTTESMQNGIDFENLVTSILSGSGDPSDFWYPAAEMIASRCANGILQYRAKKKIDVDGIPLLLYGRLDCLKAGEIIDIKFSKGYEPGKYFKSTQHPTYLELIPEAGQFTYLVSNGNSVWSETYHRYNTPSIRPVISDFLNWLKVTGLMGIYQNKWSTKHS